MSCKRQANRSGSQVILWQIARRIDNMGLVDQLKSLHDHGLFSDVQYLVSRLGPSVTL